MWRTQEYTSKTTHNHIRGSLSLPDVICFCSAARLLARKGGTPHSISYIKMPTDHQSTALPCPRPVTISGAIYSMVPIKLLVRESSSPMLPLARPKSVTLMCPSESSNTFSGCGRQLVVGYTSYTVFAHHPHTHLEVTVHKPQAVQVGNGEHHLCCVQACEFLTENALSVELEKQMTAVDEIENQIQFGTCLWGGRGGCGGYKCASKSPPFDNPYLE